MMDWTWRSVKDNMFYVSIWKEQFEALAFRARPGVPIEEYLGYVAQRIRERGWATLAMAKKTKKPSTAMAAWRAWRKITSMRQPSCSSRAIWKADMIAPRSFDVARAKEDLRLVREYLVDLSRRTPWQDRLLKVIASGHASGRDICRVASVCVIADRLRNEQLEETEEDCL
jgi:phage major head subunit gpT-like protein